MWSCPKCGRALERAGGALRCPSGHTYDVARQGYVNLAPPGRGDSGDNPQMTAARTRFLSTEAYAPLADAIAARLRAFLPQGRRVLDAGCGEGYYTARIAEALSELAPEMYGVDLSRSGIRHAAVACRAARFAVASLFALPLAEASMDAVVSVFTPLCAAQFARVLAPEGRLFVACPGPRHLFAMKSALYERPYENPDEVPVLEGFEVAQRERITYSFALEGAELIQSLFGMTPYCYKTSPAGAARLAALERLDEQADFYLVTYKRVSTL